MAPPPNFSFGRRAFRTAVFALDTGLRSANQVFEYDGSPECVFRMSLGEAGRDISLPDGAPLRPHDLVADMHFWNEHVPAMPAAGATLAWARVMRRGLDLSFEALARELRARPELAPVRAVRIATLLGQDGSVAQIGGIMRRYGFGREPEGEGLHLGQNALTLLFTLACNPAAASVGLLWRRGAAYLISRRSFEERFGSSAP